MSATTEIQNITEQTAQLHILWNDLAAAGKHAEAAGVESEIAMLEKSSARYAVQQVAERAEAARLKAVAAAQSTLARIEIHKAARAELETLVVEVEAATKAVDAAIGRLEPAFLKARATWPKWQTFDDPVQQEAYDSELGADKWPRFAPIRLGLRLPAAMATLRQRVYQGLENITSMTDASF